MPLIAFLALVVLIGTNLVAIHYSNGELAPFWNAGLRFTIAALVFAAMAVVRGSARPSRDAAVVGVLYGVFAFAMFFGFLYLGLVRVTAGLGQTILALAPLITLLIAVVIGLERLRPLAVVGAVIAMAGIALSYGVGDQLGVPLESVLLVLAAAASAAAGGIVVKRAAPADPLVRNTIATIVGAVLLLALSAVVGEAWTVPATAATWLALVYLILPGTVLVFTLFLYLLARWSATRVSYQFVLAPIVAIILGAWLLHEPVGSGTIAGTGLVIAGVYVGAFLHAG